LFWERRGLCKTNIQKLKFEIIRGFRGKEKEVEFHYLITRVTMMKRITTICHDSIDAAS
jgi:hypothetical protein